METLFITTVFLSRLYAGRDPSYKHWTIKAYCRRKQRGTIGQHISCTNTLLLIAKILSVNTSK